VRAATQASSFRTTLLLGEEWIEAVLQGAEISNSPRQLVVRLDDRRVCLNFVAAGRSEAAWSHYSEAAARRAAATGDRLLPLIATGRTDDCFYVAYDVGDAQPLSPQLERGPLSGAEFVQLLHGIGRGLDQAAAARFYPAELTPESVFVGPSRGALLADLGVAREAFGTPAPADRLAAWVAPEVLKGERAVERSAVYSLGAIMYTLLTGLPPHEGRTDQIIAADPPSLRAHRPDLPEALEVVVSTSLARDPRRRYRTASEARSLANILLQGDLVPASASQPPQGRDAPAARRRAQAAALIRRTPEALQGPKRGDADAATRRSSETALERVTAKAQAAGQAVRQAGAEAIRAGRTQAARVRRAQLEVPPRPSGRRWLAPALAGGAIALGALAGIVLAGGSDEAPAPKTFSRGGLQVRLPADWKGTAPAAGALAAHPVDEPGSGLSLELVDAPVERAEQGTPVRLGRLEAWREPDADVAGARAAVRYVIPTETGKLVATCRAGSPSAGATLETCERVASTLRLRSATGLPIAAVVAQQDRWQTEVTLLDKERAAARRNLARAELPAGQRLAAEALERLHIRAAVRFESMPGGEAVAAAARQTAASYRALARAADGESSLQFDAARARIRRSEASLRQAIAEG
jgi:hypothetical protein